MHRTNKLLKNFLLLTLPIALLITSCAPQVRNPVQTSEAFILSVDDLQPIDHAADEKLNVVATTNIAFDVVKNVGGDRIQLEALIPRGADPHAYEPSPSDLQKLALADLVFINGVDLEEPLHPTLSELADETRIISLSENLTLQSFSERDNGHKDDFEAQAHDHTGADPHVWLDPLNIQVWTQNAADALSAVDPANTNQYQGAAAVYLDELEGLNTWILEQIAEIPVDQRKLVTDHRALGYFASRYEFELIATVIPAYSTAAEPSARELGDLVDVIEDESVRAIFVGTNVNTNLADRVAQDTGIQVIPLYIGTLSPPEGPAGSYLAMMKYNVEAIVTALGPSD
jgi:ABC-type Zn uptake system ZnuABC Zn-binding protein ZnuA